MKIIHLSDVHIGKSDNKKSFNSIVNWIIHNKEKHDAKVVILTGDIVDDGALNQYREAQTQIERLKLSGLTVLAAPGNHDYGTDGVAESRECIARFKRYISGDVDYPHQVIVDNCAFIMLDSMLEEMCNYELWGAQGELGKQQLNDLSCILDGIEKNYRLSMKVVVAMHHHPFYYNYFLKLRDDELFKKVIMDEDRGDSRVDCLLFGHKHIEKRLLEKEGKYNINVIFASGSSTERNNIGRLIVSVIDLDTNIIVRFDII